MSVSPVLWVPDAPRVEQAGDVFEVSASSGSVEVRFALTRHNLLAFIEQGRRVIAKAESTLAKPIAFPKTK